MYRNMRSEHFKVVTFRKRQICTQLKRNSKDGNHGSLNRVLCEFLGLTTPPLLKPGPTTPSVLKPCPTTLPVFKSG